MTTLSIRPALAAILSLTTIVGSIALTHTSADAASSKGLHNARDIVVGQPGGAYKYRCSKKRIFFENCNWWQITCNGRVVDFRKIGCPDLR